MFRTVIAAGVIALPLVTAAPALAGPGTVSCSFPCTIVGETLNNYAGLPAATIGTVPGTGYAAFIPNTIGNYGALPSTTASNYADFLPTTLDNYATSSNNPRQLRRVPRQYCQRVRLASGNNLQEPVPGAALDPDAKRRPYPGD